MAIGLAATMTQEREDERALVAAALGDPGVFGIIYERHWLSVYRYCRAFGCDDDAALDLTATTFERAFASLSRFRGDGGGLRAWLLRIARNARIDAHRRSAHQVSIDAAASMVSPGPSLDTDAELRILVARLPEATREAIGLRYAGGLTAAEIGRVIGKRPDAVQKLISRGLAQLREAYRDR